MTVKIRTEHTKQRKWQIFYTKISVSIVEGGIGFWDHLWVCAELPQSCPTLSDSMDCSPPGSFVHGILQERNWSGLPYSHPGDLPHPRIKPGSPALQADFFTVWTTRSYFATRQYLQNCSNNTKKTEFMLEIFFLESNNKDCWLWQLEDFYFTLQFRFPV